VERRAQAAVIAAVAAGGVAGAEARYGIGVAMPHTDRQFPWSTLTVNLTGCMAIGMLMVLLLELTSPHRLARRRCRLDVAADVSGRHTHGPRDRDEQVGEVLADPRAEGENFVDRAVHVRHGAVVGKVSADRSSQLVKRQLHRSGGRTVGDRVLARQLADAGHVFDRRAVAQEVIHQVFARVGIQLEAGLDHRSARHAQPCVRAHEVEVVHVVAVAIAIGVRLDPRADGQLELDVSRLSKIDVDQFFGIEIGEFPARIAEVAMWMMDHIMNNLLSLEFGDSYLRIPLKKSPHIHHADALEIAWESVLPSADCSYVYGNPPFAGAKYQSEIQRAQVRRIARLGGSGGTLDYVTAWFLKAGEYLQQGKAHIGFVATNSITQGEQVAQLWPILFNRSGLEIAFAHRTFA